jgi:uncharacterized protein
MNERAVLKGKLSMTSTQVELDNLSQVRKGYEAFAAGDIATLTELIDPAAVWREEPTGILPGNYDGREAILAFFGRAVEETAGTFRSAPTAMAASGDTVFVQTTITGERQGRQLNAIDVLVFTIVDGRAREIVAYHGDHEQAVEFWS